MRKNTKSLFIAACLMSLAAGILRGIMNEKGFDFPSFILLAIVFFAGIVLGISFTSRGRVERFNELDDDIYTYLGEIDDVHIMKYRDKSGDRLSFAVFGFTPRDRASKEVSVGASFRKVKDEIILL